MTEDLWHEVFDGAAGSLSITEDVEVWFNIAPDTDNPPPTLGIYGSWGSFIHFGDLYFADKDSKGLSEDQIDQIKNLIGRKVICRENRLIPCLPTEYIE